MPVKFIAPAITPRNALGIWVYPDIVMRSVYVPEIVVVTDRLLRQLAGLRSMLDMPALTHRGGGGLGATHSQPAARRWMVSIAPRPLYPREITDTNCSEGWVGLRAVLDGNEIWPSPGFDPRIVEPLVSCYTDCGILAAYILEFIPKLFQSLSFIKLSRKVIS